MSSPQSNGEHTFVHEPGGGTHLAVMANDIGNFFRAELEREEAITAIANHILKYWTKRMREKLSAHLNHLGAESGLDELPRAAIERLAAGTVPKARAIPGGDAG
ncbi:MAG: formate dehydrogenase subunit delta [Pseudomonadota bacterium]|nr:formate dehydrogenase subunit delta [Pseudomonadota bacterium]